MSTNSNILKGRAFRQEEGVAEALREQADRLHLEESLALQKQSAADEARARTKEDGAAWRREAQEELDAELEKLRLEKTEATVASEEAKQELEMAEAKEKVGQTERKTTHFLVFLFGKQTKLFIDGKLGKSNLYILVWVDDALLN